MCGGVLKLDPEADGADEKEFDLAYYRSLSTADRFRMIIDRSILLLRTATNETDREPPPLSKRR